MVVDVCYSVTAMAVTAAQIQTVLHAAAGAGLDYEKAAEALDVAIFAAQINAAGELEMPWQSVGSDGTTTTRVTISDAIKLATYFRQRACGGVYSQGLEFNRSA